MNILKENRINLLKEKNNISNNKLYTNIQFDFSSLSKFNDNKNENQNFLTKKYSNYLKNKIKNNNKSIENEFIYDFNKKDIKEKNDIYNHERKKSNISERSKIEEDGENLLLSEKRDAIFDDINFCNNKGTQLRIQNPNKKKKIYEEDNKKQNIISIDEKEEERRNIRKRNYEEDEDYLMNDSYNMVGGAIRVSDRNKNMKKDDNSDRLKLDFDKEGYLY